MIKSAIRLFWTGGEDITAGRMLLFGALVWGVYSIAQILINGVVLDETLMPAQIISGAVQYPAGHPHQIYYEKAYNLFHYLAAGVWAIKPAPLVVSAARNFLFLFLSVFAPFAITALLTKRPYWGHLAAAVIVTETTLRFESIYPMWIFPNGASNGHIGLHVAMLVVVLLLAGLWRTGGLMLGLLPAIHPVMPLLIWPWSAAYFFYSRKQRSRKENVRLLCAIGLGLAVCAALALIIYIRAADSVAVPPYDAQSNAHVDGKLIHWQFTVTTDRHRRLAPLWWLAYSVGPVTLLAIGALLFWTPKRAEAEGSITPDRRTSFWLLALSAIASVYVYGAWTLHFWRGWLPSPIEIAMPYRFANFTSLLLVPVTVAAMVCAQAAMDSRARRLTLVVIAGLLFLAGSGFFSSRRPELLYALWGLLFAMDFYAYRRHARRRLMSVAAILAIGGMTLAIGGKGRYGDQPVLLMKCFMASLLIGVLVIGLGALIWSWAERKQEGKREESPATFQPAARRWLFKMNWGQVALLCACLMISLPALPRSSRDNVLTQLPRWDMISPYDRTLKEWLTLHARPNEMILPAIVPQTKIQHKTDHPALMERESLWLMSYMPDLSPVIGTMMRDLYGVDYANPDQINRLASSGRLSWYSSLWFDIWKERKRDEWQALGRKYGFRLVLSPSEAPLDLPVALPGPHWTLYEIPGG